MRHGHSIGRALIMGLVLGACAHGSDGDGTGPPALRVVVGVEVYPRSLAVTVGLTASMGAGVWDRYGNAVPGRTVTWTIADPTIASLTVHQGGYSASVTGLRVGATTVSITCDGLGSTSTVTVLPVQAATPDQP